MGKHGLQILPPTTHGAGIFTYIGFDVSGKCTSQMVGFRLWMWQTHCQTVQLFDHSHPFACLSEWGYKHLLEPSKMGSLLHILQHTFATLLLIFPRFLFFRKRWRFTTRTSPQAAAMIWDMFSTSVILIDLDGLLARPNFSSWGFFSTQLGISWDFLGLKCLTVP